MEEAKKKFIDQDESVTDNSLLLGINSITGPIIRNDTCRYAVISVFNPDTLTFEKECYVKEPKKKKKTAEEH